MFFVVVLFAVVGFYYLSLRNLLLLDFIPKVVMARGACPFPPIPHSLVVGCSPVTAEARVRSSVGEYFFVIGCLRLILVCLAVHFYSFDSADIFPTKTDCRILPYYWKCTGSRSDHRS